MRSLFLFLRYEVFHLDDLEFYVDITRVDGRTLLSERLSEEKAVSIDSFAKVLDASPNDLSRFWGAMT